MVAARGIGIGRRRLPLLVIAAIATAATLSFGLMRATAATLQVTTTSISITDANTGQPVSGTLPSTELVTLTATVTGTSSAPSGTIGFQTTTSATYPSYTTMTDQGGNSSWSVSPTGPLTSQGSVTLYLPVGTHDVQAVFRGTNGSLNSSSPAPGVPVTVTTVTVHNTSTTVTANPDSITTGQSSTLTATVVTNDGSGIVPSGTVTFYATNGNVKTFIAQSTLDANGQASFTSSSWAAQAYDIEADYLGRTYVDAEGGTVQLQTSSGDALLNVSQKTNPQVQTTTTVIATPSVIRSDQTIQLVATVVQNGTSTVQGATLESDVNFTAVSATGYAVIGSAHLVDNGDGTGTAVLNQAGWVPGTYTINAQYFGNIYFLGSSGSTSTIVVNQARPTVTTYIHDTQTYVGDTATLSAQVLDTQSQQPVPAGEIVALTADDAAGTSCLGATDSDGIASCTAVFPAPGTYTVTASYPGDSTFDPSTGFGQIAVLQVPTNVGITASPNPAPTGASDTLTGRLTDARTGAPIAGKTLTLQLNNNETCTAGPTSAIGKASCSVTVSESAGTYQTSVSFAGDGPNGKYLASTNTGSLSVVNTLPTNWTYTGTTSVYAGQPATISFVLKDGNGAVMPNRAVTLSLNGATYSETTDASGVATQAVTAPATAGSYTPTASYGAETGYLASNGTGTLQVNTIPTSLTYTGSTTVYGGTPATISFVLKDSSNNVLPGKTVTLGLPGGGSYTGTTNVSGVISDTITAPTPSTNTAYTPTASFGGSLPYLASNGSGTLNVTVVPTQVTYTGDTSANAGQPARISFVLTDATNGHVLANMPVTLTLPDGSTYSATTDANGAASKTVNAPTTTGSFPVSESFSGQAQYLSSTGSGAVVVTTIPTTVTYVGDASVYAASPARIAFRLTENATGNALAGVPLTMTLPSGATYTGTTSANGVVSTTVTAPGPSVQTTYPVSASFGGQTPYLPSVGTGALTVNPIPTVTTYTGPDHGNGGWTTVTATLVAQPTSAPLAGKTVTINVEGLTCVDTTNDAGVASCAINIKLGNGAHQVTASFAGSGYYLPSSGPGVYTGGNFKTGTSSIGFWKNSGQGVIRSSAATTGVCDVGTWLQNYAPFQDLSPTASCSDVAAYVQTVLGASTGSTMNAQLKAQMLGVALDDYFSSPSLGGNQIGASWSFGYNTYDLLSVSPAGDVSSAFGGATSMNLAAMLTFAASQSNVGGSVWYGNFKTLQSLAKDTFNGVIQGNANLR